MSAIRLLPQTFSTVRLLSTSARRLLPHSAGPSPPRLPKEDQEIYEQLQQQSTGAFSTSRQSPSSSSSAFQNQPGESLSSRPQVNQSPQDESNPVNVRVQAAGEGDELHPDVRRGARPEFEGDVNPQTGEVGGPKNEPLRWGPGGDYSFNGRVTDF